MTLKVKMRFNKQKFAVISSLALVVVFAMASMAGCGKKAKKEEAVVVPPISIPEEFDSADELIDVEEGAEISKRKIAASVSHGVGMSSTAFGLLQFSVSDWQGRLLDTPAEYKLDAVSATGMSISYLLNEGDLAAYLDGDNYRIPIKDLGEFCESVFGEDRVAEFVKSGQAMPGYDIAVEGKEIVLTPWYPEPTAVPQYTPGPMSDNGDGTYSVSVDYYYMNYNTNDQTDILARADYTLAETDRNIKGYRIVDWSMTVY